MAVVAKKMRVEELHHSVRRAPHAAAVIPRNAVSDDEPTPPLRLPLLAAMLAPAQSLVAMSVVVVVVAAAVLLKSPPDWKQSKCPSFLDTDS